MAQSLNDILNAVVESGKPESQMLLHDEIVKNKLLEFINPLIVQDLFGLGKTPKFEEPDPNLTSFAVGGPLHEAMIKKQLEDLYPSLAEAGYVGDTMVEQQAQLEMLENIIAADMVGRIAKDQALAELSKV